MKKYIKITFIILFSFILFLFASYLINDNKIKANVEKSLNEYNFFDNKKFELNVDNYTDMIMLNVITYNSKNSFVKRAFGAEYGTLYVENYGVRELYWNQFDNLKASLINQEDDSILYGRFWHGYQVLIKPLLYFFTYQQSLIFLLVIGSVLLLISCVLVFKKLNYKYLIAYILSLLSLNIYMFSTCYQYFFTMILMIIFNIIILIKYDKNKLDYDVYFYIFGALTAYLLFISFPLITLCFPLLIFFALEFENGKIINYKENICRIVKFAIVWFIGYLFFFILKWIIGTITVGNNFVENALLSVSQRLGITFSFSYIDILKLNLSLFFENILNILLVIFMIITLIVKIVKNTKEKIKIISPLLLISIMPFIWIFVCNNHSAVHYWMVARLFSISIFSLLICIIILFNNNKYTNVEILTKQDLCLISIVLLFVILYKYNLVFILISIIMLFIFKFEKKQKIFILLLVFFSSFLFIMQFINKEDFNEKNFFVDTYNELYYKVKRYGEEYVKKNNIVEKIKIDIRELIDTINSDSVFLLSCKGYIVVNEGEVNPYINCNNVMITDGYVE